jgi:hypothetical protein
MRRSSKPLPKDPNQLAHEIVRFSTEDDSKDVAYETARRSSEKTTESEISKYLSKIGRKGGLKGGKARAEKLTAKQRRMIALKAAIARWKKNK